MKRFLFCILLSPIIIYQVLADFIGIFLAKALLLIGKILIPHQTKLVISYTWSGVINAFWFKNPFLGLCVLYCMFWFVFGFEKEVANFIGVPLFFIYMLWSANLLTFAMITLRGGLMVVIIFAVIFAFTNRYSLMMGNIAILLTVLVRQIGLFFHTYPLMKLLKEEIKNILYSKEDEEVKAMRVNMIMTFNELLKRKIFNVCLGIFPSIFLVFYFFPKITILIFSLFNLNENIALLVYVYALLVSIRLAGGLNALIKMINFSKSANDIDYTGPAYSRFFFHIPLLREVVIDQWIRAVTLHYFVAIFVLGYIISFIAKNDSMSYIANLSYADMLSYSKVWFNSSLSYANELYADISFYIKTWYDTILSYANKLYINTLPYIKKLYADILSYIR